MKRPMKICLPSYRECHVEERPASNTLLCSSTATCDSKLVQMFSDYSSIKSITNCIVPFKGISAT
jgi:hypothetical protein